jgi:hypothetical protein
MKTALLLLSTIALTAAPPDPLVALDGTRITTPEQWREKRRPELIGLFTRQMYGRQPGRPAAMVTEVFDRTPTALGGKATRLQIALYPGGKSGPRIDLLIYLPNSAKGPVPAILGLNFWGNHAIHPDPGIRITESWIEDRTSYVDLSGVRDHRATEATRGVNAKHWPVDEILGRGYALATMYREDVAADHEPYFHTGVHALFPELQQGEDNFGCIAAWAWSLSRALDAIEQEPAIDSRRVAVFGFSRLGKAAVWAGATDERFAMVLSNESGAGGAKLFRRGVGEDIARLTTVFPHWYARAFRKHAGRDRELPFDQHLVLSLVAPRPLYIASALDDTMADPRGEFESARLASAVYRLHGKEGLPADQWPAPDTPVHGTIGYHVRQGRHDVMPYDWQQYLAFADEHLRKAP